ncbi:unnamed protein product [Bursaphelenchus okinawaensis]|uniref:Arrestin C-terminal-like domain-containing protein n=1 Tax=Bursaphelenchus okinawaensis TaxID=465554 RepID=A0A811LRJ1_9BILA|nr:unnamed protein product [Bursaphelenchus okinawaensis]CAG9126735.1 unnamed protein product [Bursaphelenchus okinawaensis]
MSPLPASELFQHFTVELDAGPNALFGGGERVTGHVKIKLKKATVIQVIRIQFKGRACLKDHKKGHDIEKIFFDKDFVLLERPPGKPDPGHFQWKADFDYSLPFEYLLPVGCPSSFESPDAFVRYFARVTLQTCEDQSPIYIAKRHFSIYDLESTAAVNPQYEEPYTYRKSFKSSGCCCCKRKIYMELVMPKRVFHANEILQSKLIIDNISDTKIAQNIAYNIVERISKTDTPDNEVQKQPARVIKSGKVNGENVEKRRNTIVINQLDFPAAPISISNSLALSTLPREKSTPALSPDDSATKLFDHPSIISQSRKEPLFDIHYALQILIGKFLIEVPFTVKPTDPTETKSAFQSPNHSSNVVKFVPSQVTEISTSGHGENRDPFAEPDETDKLFVGSADYSFVPLVPVYEAIPKEENEYQWPALGTFGPNNKLIWHPDEKEEKEKKEQEAKELKAQRQREAKEAKKKAKELKKEKADNKETEPLIKNDGLAEEPEASTLVVETTEVRALEPTEDGTFVETEKRYVETRTVKVIEQHGDGEAQITETVTVTEGHDNEAPTKTVYTTSHNEHLDYTPPKNTTEVVVKQEPTPEVQIIVDEPVASANEDETTDNAPGPSVEVNGSEAVNNGAPAAEGTSGEAPQSVQQEPTPDVDNTLIKTEELPHSQSPEAENGVEKGGEDAPMKKVVNEINGEIQRTKEADETS